MNVTYEKILHKDPEFPFIFHVDDRFSHNNSFSVHWHESVEILYFTEGKAQVNSDNDHEVFTKGDIAIINSDSIHSIYPVTSFCQYYCLLIDRAPCAQLGMRPEFLHFPIKITDGKAAESMENIRTGFEQSGRFAKTALRLDILRLFCYLAQNYSVDVMTRNSDASKKTGLARSIITYIDENFDKPLTTEDICNNLGFSKYYVCHCFREITGQTVTSYLNFRRCSNARKMLTSGKCNVSEAAAACGFSNLSYFSKMYKRCIGVLPSAESSD